LICWGTLFERVILRGEVGSIMLHGVPDIRADRVTNSVRLDSFYRNVEWALDIRNANFSDFSVRTGAIPLNLIRRDLGSQFIVSRPKGDFTRPTIEAMPISNYSKCVLNMMLDEEMSEYLLVAPKSNKELFSVILKDATWLCANGLIR
jgi:hypothetical protein